VIYGNRYSSPCLEILTTNSQHSKERPLQISEITNQYCARTKSNTVSNFSTVAVF